MSLVEALAIYADIRARVLRGAAAWLCLYAFLAVGSIMSGL
jgi:hypothetical protein